VRKMANEANRLTPLKVKAASAPGYLSDGLGLYLQIAKTGTKSWAFRYERQGKRRELGLGPCHTISLADARLKAADLRRQLIDGIDPFTTRAAAKLAKQLEEAKAATFDQCAKEYIASHRAGWKNAKHATQWETTIATYASPIIGRLAVADIDTGLVLKVLENDGFWTDKPETASRLRGRIEAILDYATARKLRIGDNPARLKGNLDHLLPTLGRKGRVKHHPALAYARVGAFLADLRQVPGVSARALEFAILTATRSGETRLATWAEFDLDEATWTIPSTRMKAKIEHRVPLSAPAVALLEKLKAEATDEIVFPGVRGKPLSDMTLTQAIRRMDTASTEAGGDGWKDRDGNVITAHGYRSTFRDGAGETTAYPREVIEHALAHQLKDKAEAAYQRGDLLTKRRRLMDDWATYCAAPPADAKVIPIMGTGNALKTA
jgi:integrase